jgi:uncharacterized membrane protein YkoI
MTMLAPIAAVWMLSGIAAATANDEIAKPGCYSKLEQRALLERREIVSLAEALRVAQPQRTGDILRAQLCQGPKGRPVYVLTLLPTNGKVTRMTIDAKSGDMIDGNTGTVMSGSR